MVAPDNKKWQKITKLFQNQAQADNISNFFVKLGKRDELTPWAGVSHLPPTQGGSKFVFMKKIMSYVKSDPQISLHANS